MQLSLHTQLCWIKVLGWALEIFTFNQINWQGRSRLLKHIPQVTLMCIILEETIAKDLEKSRVSLIKIFIWVSRYLGREWKVTGFDNGQLLPSKGALTSWDGEGRGTMMWAILNLPLPNIASQENPWLRALLCPFPWLFLSSFSTRQIFPNCFSRKG